MRWLVPIWIAVVIIMLMAFGTDNDRDLEDYLDGVIGDARPVQKIISLIVNLE